MYLINVLFSCGSEIKLRREDLIINQSTANIVTIGQRLQISLIVLNENSDLIDSLHQLNRDFYIINNL